MSAFATSRGGHRGSISDRAWREQAIDFRSDLGNPHNPAATFVDAASAAHGFPSELSRGGNAFTITWEPGPPSAQKSAAPPGSA